MAPENITGLSCQNSGESQVLAVLNQAAVDTHVAAPRSKALREHRLEQIQTILRTALDRKHAISLEKFKRSEPYPESEPSPVRFLGFPPEPQPHDPPYRVSASLAANSSEFEARRREAYERYLLDYTAWSERVKEIEAENQQRYAEQAAALKRWKEAREKHLQARAAQYEFVARQRAAYEAMRSEGVEDYFRQVITDSPLPGSFRRVFDLQYLRPSRVMIVEHSLPLPEALPPIKGMRRGEDVDALIEVPLSEAQINRIYVRVLCEIALRTLHELFDADDAGVLDTVIFNGWFDASAGIGRGYRRTVVASVQARREEFKRLRLGSTDAEVCYRALNGRLGAAWQSFNAVEPILKITRPEIGRMPAFVRPTIWGR